MISPFDRLSNIELGRRLRVARELASTTQSAAAEWIDVARTTIVAIEKGQRRIRIDELQRLAALYGTSANSILRREAIHLDLVPRFRRLPESRDESIAKATHILNNLVGAELELEQALGIEPYRHYPPERPLLPGDVRIQAEQDAQDLRDWLGFGSAPVLDVISLLETHFRIRVYIRILSGKVSGLFAFDDRAGPCILLNANHPPTRLRQTAIHELSHFLATREKPDIHLGYEHFDSPAETYANYFSRYFLTPSRAVRQRFATITAGQSHFTRRHVILLAYAFAVSREAIVRRLEELRLVREGTWDWFMENGGITEDDVRKVIGDRPDQPLYSPVASRILPPRIALLVREVWKKGLYSEGQLARLFCLSRLDIREVLDGIEQEEREGNELFRLPH